MPAEGRRQQGANNTSGEQEEAGALVPAAPAFLIEQRNYPRLDALGVDPNARRGLRSQFTVKVPAAVAVPPLVFNETLPVTAPAPTVAVT